MLKALRVGSLVLGCRITTLTYVRWFLHSFGFLWLYEDEGGELRSLLPRVSMGKGLVSVKNMGMGHHEVTMEGSAYSCLMAV
jgi:hypothetical protein